MVADVSVIFITSQVVTFIIIYQIVIAMAIYTVMKCFCSFVMNNITPYYIEMNCTADVEHVQKTVQHNIV